MQTRTISTILTGLAFAGSPIASQAEETRMTANHPYLGTWITEDGHVRQQLKPDGRYAEARGTRENAYEGRYEVEGRMIFYWDDTGFTADGEFIDGVLHHGGMIMRRKEAVQ